MTVPLRLRLAVHFQKLKHTHIEIKNRGNDDTVFDKKYFCFVSSTTFCLQLIGFSYKLSIVPTAPVKKKFL